MFMKESAIEDRKMISIYTQHGTIQIQKKTNFITCKERNDSSYSNRDTSASTFFYELTFETDFKKKHLC